jgi:uncharacterized membrane protein YbhN (UPF0104 family)
LARVAATVAMLGVLLRWVKLRSLFPVWHDSTLWWLAGGVACTTAAIVLSALRWQRVLVAMNQATGLGTLVNAYLACQFVSNFLPSTIGGDAVRVARVSSRTGEVGGGPEAPAAFASVVLDRMSGWLILPLLCLAGLLINPALLRLGDSTRAAIALSVVTLLGLVATVTVAASTRLGGRLAHHSNWLRFMGAVHLGLDRIRRRPGAVLQVIAASLVYQLAIVAAAVLAVHALDIDVGPTALLAFVPAVAIVQVLPVTIGGFGLREGAFALFLHPLGVTTDEAVSLGLVMYAMHLLSSLLGAPSFAAGRRPRPVGVAASPDPVAPAA